MNEKDLKQEIENLKDSMERHFQEMRSTIHEQIDLGVQRVDHRVDESLKRLISSPYTGPIVALIAVGLIVAGVIIGGFIYK